MRRATPEDAGNIARLHVRVWQWAYRGLIPDEYLAALAETIERRKARRSIALDDTDGDQRTWVIERDGEILGFADTGPSRDEDAGARTGEVYAIYVDESAARQGIGTALLVHSVDDLRGRGFTPMTLWVLHTNDGARRFYEGLGWTVDGASRIDCRPGFELHEVRYRLDPDDGPSTRKPGWT